MRYLFITFLILVTVSCTGYQLGGRKPSHLQHIQSIHVPVFANDTQFPRAAIIGTHSFLDNLAEDGTYRIAHLEQSDAWLKAKIKDIHYTQVRSDLEDILRSEELEMNVVIEWQLYDSKGTGAVLAKGSASGHTRFFAEENLQTARNNALPDALQRAALNIISRIADGF